MLPCEMPDNSAVVDGICLNIFSCVSWGKIFRRALWGDARFPVGVDLGEDMMTVPAVIIRARSAVVAPKAVYYWRQRRKSLLHGTVTQERLKKDLLASEIMANQLTQYAPEREHDFNILKMQYDIGCVANFLKSNPGVERGKSRIYALLQAAGKL